jgi:hypothetical protein
MTNKWDLRKTRVMILPSVDGQEYARVVVLPENMDMLQAYDLALTAIKLAVDANPVEYGWDEVAASLEESGFIIALHTIDGPLWDAQ